KKEQKTAEKSVAGPLRKHRTRTEKIDDLKKQISDLRKAGKPKNIYGLQQFVESEEFKVDFKNDF
ncbi:TPA: hypothetical protein ACGP6G_004806, partial [Escherichia coli]